MKKIFLLGLTLATLTTSLKAQIIGNAGYMPGYYVNVGVAGNGGYEGADTNAFPASGIIPGLHPRGNTGPHLGFTANPQMNAWLTFNGDFFTPGSPENGWGIELNGPTNVNASNNRVGDYDIPGAFTGFEDVNGCLVLDWEGDYVDANYNLHILVRYQLKKEDLFYTTTVTMYNNGANTIPELYYYRNVDPDNNVTLPGGTYSTTNTIVNQPVTTCSKALVSATQSGTFLSYMGFAAIGADYRVAKGGFSNRDASDIWNGVSGLTGAVGSVSSADEAIALAYRTQNLAAGDSATARFVVILDAAQVDAALNSYMSFEYIGALADPPACIANIDSAISCSGNPLTIEFDGSIEDDFTWTWSPATGLDTTEGNLVHAFPSDTTLYTITGTPINPCFTTNIVSQIVVIPAQGPEISMDDPGIHCDEYDLNNLVYTDVNGLPGTVSFYIENEPTNPADTSLHPGNMIYPGDSVYLMIVEPTLGCYDYQYVDVEWSSGFTFDATVVHPNCMASDGSIEIINVTGNMGPVSYQWTGGPTTPLYGSIPSGTYTVVMVDSIGCDRDTTINFPNNTAMTSSIAVDAFAECGQASGAFTVTAMSGSPAYSYDIGSGAQPSGSFTGLSSGLYVVEITDQAGCLIFDSIVMPDTSTLDLSVASFINAHCGATDGSVTLGATGGITPYSYTFASTTQASPTFGSIAPGNYMAYVTGTGGCQDSVTFTITDIMSLTASLVDTNAAICANPNGSVQVTAANGAAGVYSFSIPGHGTQATGNFTGLTAGPYTMTVTSGTCTTTVAFVIGLDPGSLSLAPADITSENCGMLNGILEVQATGGTTPYDYTIDNFATTQASPQFTGIDDGPYVVAVSDPNGCIDTIHMYVPEIPIQIDLGEDVLYCNQYTIPGNGVGDYLWSTGSTANEITVTQAGDYWLTVSRPGCFDTDTIHVDFILSPIITPANVFTPNGDGHNDKFVIDGMFVTSFVMKIYNRWGQVVFETDDITKSWDGSMNGGSDAGEGVYMYIIEYDNPCESPSMQTRQGSVQLLR